MKTPSLSVLGCSLVAGVVLFGGCVIEDPGRISPGDREAQAIQLIEVGEDGAACLRLDDLGAVQCFESEAEADEALAIGAAAGVEDPLASPPGCVHTNLADRGWTDYLTVTNTCKQTVRVKVVIAFGTDFACYTFGPGASRNYWWGYPRRFDKLVTC
jgi:hypothetical protein